MNLKRFSRLFALVVGMVLTGAVSVAAGEEMVQPRRLVDAHTAGVLPRATYDFECRVYASGSPDVWGSGLQLAIGVGITDRLNIGISYGGDGLVGRGRSVQLNPYPGGLIKYRLIEENYHFPAVAIGYEHQGYGGILDDNSGFVYKSQGFFVALSKNYLFIKRVQLGIHGAASYSLEDITSVPYKGPNGYLGFDFGINSELALAVEYDLGFNTRDPGVSGDRREDYVNPLKGQLNAGLRWAFSPSFYLQFDFKDLLENRDWYDVAADRYHRFGWSRELKLVYLNSF